MESFFGHVMVEWPHLTRITDPAVLSAALDRARAEYNGTRLHESLGYVTPNDEHEGAASRSARHGRRGCSRRPGPARRSTVESRPITRRADLNEV